MNDSIIFRQLFDAETWTYTYILADTASREAIIIDPVRERVERDTKLLAELGLGLKYVLDTHVHADHVTGSGKIRELTGAQIAMGEGAAMIGIDVALRDGDTLQFWNLTLQAISTPGHTDGCMSFLVDNMLFTGDSLLVRKTGRTDFQGGSPERLYESIRRMYALPDETLVFPGHDYDGYECSSIGEEKRFNSRLKDGTAKEEFVGTMRALKLEYPKRIDEALPANRRLGLG